MSVNHVFVINGFPLSGKDTFVEMCQKFLIENRFITWSISSVDKVKEAAKLLGWDGVKDAKGRKFLSDLKDMSTECYDGPYNYMAEAMNMSNLLNFKEVFFFHIREPQEIERMVKDFNAKTICLHRYTSEKDHDNTGDSSVLDYTYDYHIYNNGTLEELKEKAEDLMSLICLPVV